MWIVVQRGRYYSEMEGNIYALLCRQYAEDGKQGPTKMGEAETYQEAQALTKRLQLERRNQEGEQHATVGEVDGCSGGGDPAEGMEEGGEQDTAGAGNEKGVCSGGSGEGSEPSDRIPADGAAGDQVDPKSRLDAQQQGMLPAKWAQDDDVLAGVRGEECRLPVFTGERYCRMHPREAKAMVNLRFVYGFPVREVAKILGCSPQTVSNVCSREIGSMTVMQFRDAMAARLRGSTSDLVELVQQRIGNDDAMRKEGLRDIVAAMEKVGALLQQMEATQAPNKAKEGQDPDHDKDMENAARDYLARLKRVDVQVGE